MENETLNEWSNLGKRILTPNVVDVLLEGKTTYDKAKKPVSRTIESVKLVLKDNKNIKYDIYDYGDFENIDGGFKFKDTEKIKGKPISELEPIFIEIMNAIKTFGSIDIECEVIVSLRTFKDESGETQKQEYFKFYTKQVREIFVKYPQKK
jgi:hypothetical protein